MEELMTGRDAIIFGNGLGMALDPEHFNLENSIRRVWDNLEILSIEQKLIISKSAGLKPIDPPIGENQLDTLHLIVKGCEYLQMLAPCLKEKILTKEALLLPQEIFRFIHAVSYDLYSYTAKKLPDVFINSLSESIKQYKHHVVTLNYDGLLYKEFIHREICDGYSGELVDGIWGQGFNPENLIRKYGRDFGYYLHLHGSPLFYGNDPVHKYHINNVENNPEKNGKHIVLTHVRHKPKIISQSQILNAYWFYLPFCLNEAEQIHLIGYSGMDNHLNEAIFNHLREISKNKDSKQVNIIEWGGSREISNSYMAERIAFWKEKIYRDNIKIPYRLKLIHAENILTGPYKKYEESNGSLLPVAPDRKHFPRFINV